MLYFLALAVAAVPQNVAAVDLFSVASQVPKDLFYLASKPSGTMFCEKAQKRRQTKAFDKRFGKRFNKLVDVVRKRDGLGWSGDEIIVTPCYRPSHEQAKIMLDDFESELSAYEKRFKLASNVR